VIEKPNHLTDEAEAILTASIDERIYFIHSKRWVAYPKAMEILDHLNNLLRHPRRAVQRYLLKVIENMDLRPPRAAA
jgi:hypothetical protein